MAGEREKNTWCLSAGLLPFCHKSSANALGARWWPRERASACKSHSSRFWQPAFYACYGQLVPPNKLFHVDLLDFGAGNRASLRSLDDALLPTAEEIRSRQAHWLFSYPLNLGFPDPGRMDGMHAHRRWARNTFRCYSEHPPPALTNSSTSTREPMPGPWHGMEGRGGRGDTQPHQI